MIRIRQVFGLHGDFNKGSRMRECTLSEEELRKALSEYQCKDDSSDRIDAYLRSLGL